MRAGQRQWRHLLHVAPERYLAAEAEEEKLRAQLGDVAILKEQRQGVSYPLPLRELRRRATMPSPWLTSAHTLCRETEHRSATAIADEDQARTVQPLAANRVELNADLEGRGHRCRQRARAWLVTTPECRDAIACVAKGPAPHRRRAVLSVSSTAETGITDNRGAWLRRLRCSYHRRGLDSRCRWQPPVRVLIHDAAHAPSSNHYGVWSRSLRDPRSAHPRRGR